MLTKKPAKIGDEDKSFKGEESMMSATETDKASQWLYKDEITIIERERFQFKKGEREEEHWLTREEDVSRFVIVICKEIVASEDWGYVFVRRGWREKKREKEKKNLSHVNQRLRLCVHVNHMRPILSIVTQ